MIATIAASTGINQSYTEGVNRVGGMLYGSPAAHIGKGERSDPNQQMPVWTPAPGAYNTRQEAHANHAPKFK